MIKLAQRNQRQLCDEQSYVTLARLARDPDMVMKGEISTPLEELYPELESIGLNLLDQPKY